MGKENGIENPVTRVSRNPMKKWDFPTKLWKTPQTGIGKSLTRLSGGLWDKLLENCEVETERLAGE